MNILTDEEIEVVHEQLDAGFFGQQTDIDFAHAIESAVLSKLAEQAGAETVGYFFQHEDTGEMMSVDVRQVEWGFEKNNPRLINCGKLYTEAQLIAAQQRTAEACACFLDDFDAHPLDTIEGVLNEHAEAIRNGEWREYL